MRIYIAGPFFNSESKLVLNTLLVKLESLGHECWVPMRDGITCPKDADRAMRQKVFNLDCEMLHWADCVVALLDYPLPVYQETILRERTPEGTSREIPLHLPDSGTIFEIGYVAGLNGAGRQYRCIVGYASILKFNLMVAEACDCVVDDLDGLEQVIGLVEKQDEDGLLSLKTEKQKELQEF